MYKTDKQRAAEGRPSYYTAPELDAACAAYFEDCDANDRQPTKPGLLLHLGVTEKEWKVWEAGEPGYTRHPAICQKGVARNARPTGAAQGHGGYIPTQAKGRMEAIQTGQSRIV